MKTIEQINSSLSHCTGTEGYTRFGLARSVVATDGAMTLAKEAEAYWLLDAIASYIATDPKVKAEDFQVWELKVDGEKAVLTMKTDSSRPAMVEQEIEYTSFPEPGYTLWVELGGESPDGPVLHVILLPSEH